MELCKVGFQVLEIQGLKLHPKNKLRELNARLALYYPFRISLILLTFDVKELMLRTAY